MQRPNDLKKVTPVLCDYYGQYLNDTWKSDAETSVRCATEDTAYLHKFQCHLFVHASEDIATDVPDALSNFVEYICSHNHHYANSVGILKVSKQLAVLTLHQEVFVKSFLKKTPPMVV